MRLTHEAYVDHVRAESALLVEAVDAAGVDLQAEVPSCPGWLVRDLVEHVAEVYWHKVACIRLKAFPHPWPPERDDTPTLSYFQAGLRELLAELTSRPPTEFAETWWWDERTVGFWARRMAHETVIHRVDAELAAQRTPSAIDEALAVDGIDEVLRLHLAGDWSDEPVEGRPGTVVRVVSGDHAWRVVMEPAAIVAQVDRWPDIPVHAELTADPVPLYLWLWGRGPRGAALATGNAAAIAHLEVRLRSATQ